MTEVVDSRAIPEGLIIAAPGAFQVKVADFVAAGVASMHAVLDFDRTLTVKKLGSDDEVTTWHILREHLPKDGQVRYQDLFDTYRSRELAGTMTREDAIIWWSDILNLFVQYRVDLAP